MGFNGHPPLGVNATTPRADRILTPALFQWAPTLGGECYVYRIETIVSIMANKFQWAPTLGGECYSVSYAILGYAVAEFQWAPTLGGECYVAQNAALPR